MMMNRCHSKDAFARALEGHHLQNHRHGLHNKNPTHYDERHCLMGHERDCSHEAAQSQRTSVSHENFCRMRVVPQKRKPTPDDSSADDAQLAHAGHIRNEQVLGNNDVSRRVGHDRVHDGYRYRTSDGQPVYSIGHVDCIAGADENEQQEQVEEENVESQAMISSAVTIANSFILDFSFRSNADWGSTSIGVIQGDDPQNGYHLVYQASPAENRPMQLIKYRYGKQYIIDEVYENSPDLDDGADHAVRLIRSPNGDMVVTIDDIEVMRTSDFSFRDDFAGVVIVNNGGSYSYGNIEIFIEQ